MSRSFLVEIARQRREALAWLHHANRGGDSFLVEVARNRLAELAELAHRVDPAT